MEWSHRFRKLFAGLELRASAKWFLLSAAIGVVAGVGGVVFQLASQSVLHFTLESVAGYAPQEPTRTPYRSRGIHCVARP